MGGVRQEKSDFYTIFFAACACAEENGFASEKLLVKKLKIERPTAVKVLAAMKLAGLVKAAKKDFDFVPNAAHVERIRQLSEKYPTCYIPLVEADKDFKSVSVDSYIRDVLMPAFRMGFTFGGSVSPIYLQRKLGVVIERANEVFCLLDCAGFVGEEDPNNPARRSLTVSFARYDSLALEYGVQ